MRRWNQTVAAMELRLDKEQHMKIRALLSLPNIGKNRLILHIIGSDLKYLDTQAAEHHPGFYVAVVTVTNTGF